MNESMIGTTLQKRYRLEAELGRGGMSTVYRAFDTELEREVAVKLMARTALGAVGRRRLLREARAIAKLNHPNIVTVYDVGEIDEGPFIVMELVEGQSLYEHRPENLDELIAIARQVCAALVHAHAQDIIHRDLKPENVIIHSDGTAKLMDFGMARYGASRLTQEGEILGTVFYLAPEQALGKEIDARTDLYALGVMLYELSTGSLPYEGDDPLAVISQHIHAEVVPPKHHNADLPITLNDLIVSLMGKDPADRPESAAVVLQALEEPEGIVDARVAERLEIHTLGGLSLCIDGDPVDNVGSKKAEALLVYLAVNERAYSREVLAEMLWHESPQERAMSNLRGALSNLRKYVGEYVHITRDQVSIRPEGAIWLDVSRIRSLIEKGELARAVDLYRGDFLEGFYVRKASGFEDWQGVERERVRHMIQDALQELVASNMEQGRFKDGIPYARRLLEMDPLREATHRDLMCLLAYTGQRVAALAQYEHCRKVLAEELAIEPMPETVDLFEQIVKGELLAPVLDVVERADAPPELRLELPPFLERDLDVLEIQQPDFVCREKEMARLDDLLEVMLKGQSQVAFVVGNSGQGKTALLHEFARRARRQHPDLIVANGNCNAFSDAGDPYLPFRDVMRMLGGDVEAKLTAGGITPEQAHQLWALLPNVVQALVSTGPDLIDVFVPGSGLISRGTAALREGSAWIERLKELSERAKSREGDPEQQNLFEQYRRVLGAIAKQQPLMLLLDDLQWADGASISLLFHLGRRLGQSRVLILGAYRPDEVAAGRAGERHPLEKVLAEFKRQYGDVWVDLREEQEAEGRAFIDAYLDLESNRLGDDFRAEMHRHTGGFPLFTLELMRDMRERGDLVLNEDGFWVEGRDLDWDQLPARVEGVIEERVGRLDADLQDLLSLAAVEGARFTVQVLAEARESGEPQEIEKLVDRLEQSQGLVISDGIEALDGQKIYRYRFQHVMFQQYLYHQLSAVKRELLHAGVGRALETLYAERTEMVAVQLVQHFDQAGQANKVLIYAIQAGDRARRLGASIEAIEAYKLATEKALAGEDELELHHIYERLGDVYLINLSKHDEALQYYEDFLAHVDAIEEQARGERKLATIHLLRGELDEAQEHYEQALEHLREASAMDETSRVHYGLAYVHIYKNQPEQAGEHARICLDISERGADVRGLADANKVLGAIAKLRGELDDSLEHHERSLSLYREINDLPRTAQAYNNVADTYRLLGEMNSARKCLREGLKLARRVGDIREEALLLLTIADVAIDLGNWVRALVSLDYALPLAEESGVAARRVDVHWLLGMAYSGAGRSEEAFENLQLAGSLCRETQNLRRLPEINLAMAHVHIKNGELVEGREVIERALDAAGPEPSDVLRGLILMAEGELHFAARDWGNAIQAFEESLKALEDTGQLGDVGKGHLGLGRVYAERGRQGDREGAIEHFNEAQPIFEKLGATFYLDRVKGGLKDIERET